MLGRATVDPPDRGVLDMLSTKVIGILDKRSAKVVRTRSPSLVLSYTPELVSGKVAGGPHDQSQCYTTATTDGERWCKHRPPFCCVEPAPT